MIQIFMIKKYETKKYKTNTQATTSTNSLQNNTHIQNMSYQAETIAVTVEREPILSGVIAIYHV